MNIKKAVTARALMLGNEDYEGAPETEVNVYVNNPESPEAREIADAPAAALPELDQGEVEVAETEEGAGELEDLGTAMEALAENIRISKVDGGMTPGEVRFATLHYNELCRRVGFRRGMPGLESFATPEGRELYTQVGLEDVEKKEGGVIQGVVEAFKKMIAHIVEFFRRIFSHSERLKRHVEAMRKANAKSMDGTGSPVSLRGRNNVLISKSGTIDESSTEKSLQLVNTYAEWVYGKYATSVDGLVTKVVDAVSGLAKKVSVTDNSGAFENTMEDLQEKEFVPYMNEHLLVPPVFNNPEGYIGGLQIQSTIHDGNAHRGLKGSTLKAIAPRFVHHDAASTKDHPPVQPLTKEGIDKTLLAVEAVLKTIEANKGAFDVHAKHLTSELDKLKQALEKPAEGDMKHGWVSRFIYRAFTKICSIALLSPIHQIGVIAFRVALAGADYCDASIRTRHAAKTPEATPAPAAA